MRWVSWLSGVRLALDSIRESKLRAFLTVLGVIIGTGTIIGVGSIIAGLDGAITDILRSFGPHTLIVFKFRGILRTGRLTPEEAQAQAAHFRECHRDPGTLSFGRPCESLSAARLESRSEPSPL